MPLPTPKTTPPSTSPSPRKGKLSKTKNPEEGERYRK
jgi:hypothetical protein